MSENVRLGSSYTLLERLDSGAMGHVWRGTDEAGSQLAFKLLRSEFADDQDIVNRFLQERSLLTTLRHPNIVSVYDIVAEGATLAIVMDLVRGENLRSHLSAAGALTPAHAVELAAGICDGLAAVHAAGIVHRDIKPENVLLDTTGERPIPRVGDFGLAKLISADPASPRSSMMVGTPTYMAPEIADGQEPSAKADVYAVGVLLYELVCGVPPFASTSTYRLIQDHAQVAPGRPSGVPDPLWHLIDWMLSKSPTARPTAAQARDELRGIEPLLAGVPRAAIMSAPPPGSEISNRPTMQVPRPEQSSPPASESGVPSEQTKRRRRSPIVLLSVAAVVLALLGGGGWWLLRDRGETPAAAAAPVRTPAQGTATSPAAEESSAVAPATPSSLAMPDLVSKSLSQTSVLLPPGTTVETTDALDEDAIDGTILNQEPAAGTQPIPTVVKVTVARQSVTNYLEDLDQVDGNLSQDSAEVDGRVFPHSLSTYLRRDPTASYNIGRDYRRFVATVGLSDDSTDSTSKATFEVFADGRKVFDETVGYGRAAEIDLDVTGVLRLELVNGLIAGGDARVVWGDARLLGLPGEVPMPTGP